MSGRKHVRVKSLASSLTVIDTRTARIPSKIAEPFYLSAPWRTLMTRLIKQRGRQCEYCGRAGCRIFGDHVVELKDGGEPLEERNVMLLCGSCHTRKTATARATRLTS